ncbi:MAG: aromatic amino acid transport family protein [Candidatus Omnitrophota bacterium]
MLKFWQGVLLLVGTIIGVGVFSLPYSFAESGWGISLMGLIFLAFAVTVLNLFYSQIILDNHGDRQLVGYVGEYLGPFWKKITLISLVFSLTGVMIAYVVLGGEFLALVLGQSAGFFYPIWFLLIIAFLFLRDFKSLINASSIFSIILLVLFLVFPIFIIKYVDLTQISLIGRQPLFFWGPILLALSGFSAIPEVEEVLRKGSQRKKLKKVVVVGTWLPVLVYIIFSFSVYGVTGVYTTADSLSGLVHVAPYLVRIGSGIGLLALLTSFLSLANVVKETYYRDLKIDEGLSRIFALAPTTIGIFLALDQFANIISFVGAIGVAVTSSLICFLFARIKKGKKWVALLVSLVFISGAIAKILEMIK